MRIHIQGGHMPVLKTKDYEIFKRNAANRPYNEDNIKKLMNSIAVRNKMHLNPVIVDKEMRIMNGQHRVEAAKRIGAEVYYIIDEEAKVEDMILMNANQKNWQLSDYLNYYCQRNHSDYVQLDQFIKEHQVSIMQIRALMGESSNFSDNFKKGKYIFPKKDKFEKFESRLKNLRYVQNYIATKIPNTKIAYDGSHFMHALLEFFNIKKVDVGVFFEKLEYKLDLLRPCTNRIAYMMIFKSIYNFKNANPIE